METYKATQGQSVYDVAAALYKSTYSGIRDLISTNGIDLSADLAGTVLSYNVSATQERKKLILVDKIQSQPVFVTRYRQNKYDLAINLYGSISGLPEIIKLFPDLSAEIPVGTVINYPEAATKEAAYFRGKLVACDPIVVSVPSGDGILLEDGSGFILTETGDNILLE